MQRKNWRLNQLTNEHTSSLRSAGLIELYPENMADRPHLRLHSLEYDEIFPKFIYQCPLLP